MSDTTEIPTTLVIFSDSQYPGYPQIENFRGPFLLGLPLSIVACRYSVWSAV